MTKEIKLLNSSNEYKALITDLKEQIRSSRIKAALSVNSELIQLYWSIGKQIIEKQENTDWGSKLLEFLSKDLQNSFPETRGFSISNLKHMRQFAASYKDGIGQQSVVQLPWGHIILLIQSVKNNYERNWYIQETLTNGWSRHNLSKQIKSKLYERKGIDKNKISNYLNKLPSPQSHLAQETLKNPYNFDFLGLHDDACEREIENASIKHITKFLLELGKGFAFVGNQVPITVDDEEFFIDMLFYNLKLRCYVVIEIKATKFKPAHAGQINFYLSAVDSKMKHKDDNPSIGILLCKSHKKTVAEYALRNISSPIGISEYELTKSIPSELESELPSIQEIEDELNNICDEDNKT